VFDTRHYKRPVANGHQPVTRHAAAPHHHAATRTPPADADRRHWLLLIPIVLPLMTPLFNRLEPRVFGIPFFYWSQLSLAALSTAVMTMVYLTTRGR
jgi:hypothetical protein